MPSDYGRDRILWIDTAKSLGILLVFLGHVLYYNNSIEYVTKAIYSFHMPMYFMLSGMVMRRLENRRKFLWIKFIRLLLPVIIAYLLFTPLFFLLEESSFYFSIHDVYITGSIAHNPPLWFFICLFEVYCIVALLGIYDYSRKLQLMVSVVSFILVAIVIHFKLPLYFFGIDKAILGFAFFSLGIVMKDYISGLFEKRYLVVLLMVLWFMLGVLLNGKTSMYGFTFNHYTLFVLGANSGSLTFFFLAKKLENNQFIMRYSQYTIFIIVSHYLLVVVFNRIINNWGIVDPVAYFVVSILYVALCILLYLPLSRVVVKYFPLINGRIKS